MSNEHILITDGEPDLLRLCSRILSRDGYNVYTAGSAQQAVAIARATPLDLAIVDVRLSDMDGISAFEALHVYQPDMVGIITTSYPSLESAMEALHKGISGFVLKPFTPAELRHAVFDALRLHRLDQENARLKALIPLYEVSRCLMTTTDLEALFEQVIEVAIKETGADRVSLMVRENGELALVAARGLPAHMIGTTRTQIGDGVAGWVAKHGQPLLLDSTVTMPPELADALTQDEIASAVCVPLTVQGHVIGVLNLSKLKGTERLFTPSDRDLISVLAGQVAIAIENARLFRQQHELAAQLAHANAKLRALQEAATAMTSRLSPGRVLETILDGCAAVVEDASIAVGLLDLDESLLEIHLHLGEVQSRRVVRVALSEQDVQALRTTSGAHGVMTQHLAAQLQTPSGVTQIGVLLLTVHDQLIGAMAVGSAGGLTEADVHALAPFADQAAVAIANARHFTQLQGPIQLSPLADAGSGGSPRGWIVPANEHGDQREVSPAS